MDEKKDTVIFRTDDGSEITFTVISETRLNGNNYILVTDEVGEEAFILRESFDENEDMVYEMVDDDTEIDAVGGMFRAILEDIDLV
ncbi:MAG: DUF1292 domain-containing protein [Lachnospiraceae bacterium]|nr:DUF1292 domain-containing protein [Lachnospiraceae bacterium]